MRLVHLRIHTRIRVLGRLGLSDLHACYELKESREVLGTSDIDEMRDEAS